MSSKMLMIVIFAFMKLSEGSQLAFTSTPTAVSPCTGKPMTLRCSIVNTQAVVGRRAITQTQYDTNLVLSMFITHSDQSNITLGSVSLVTGGVAKSEVANVHATGTTSSQTSEKAFLELTWDNPTAVDAGDYFCEINAIDPQGHSVVYLGKLTLALDASACGGSSGLTSKVTALEQELAAMKATLDKLSEPHAETGVIVCDSADTWVAKTGLTLVDYNKGFDGRQVVKNITFTEKYDNAPVVQVGVQTLGAMSSEPYVSYNIKVESVDENGFSMTCTTWGQANIYRLNVNWMSVVA